MKYIVIGLMGLLLLNGCSIIRAASQPRSRPPEAIVPGITQASIDKIYGEPMAVGMSADGKEYIEQLQFVDGIPLGWKIGRIAVHTILDGCTFFLWELIGFPIEVIYSEHPEYIYYVVYDDSDNVIRAISQDSEEGLRLARLPWSATNQGCYEGDSRPRVRRLRLEERIAAAEKIINETNKAVLSKNIENKESINATSKTKNFSRLPAKDISKSKQKGKSLGSSSSSLTIETMLEEGLITKEEYERITK